MPRSSNRPWLSIFNGPAIVPLAQSYSIWAEPFVMDTWMCSPPQVPFAMVRGFFACVRPTKLRPTNALTISVNIFPGMLLHSRKKYYRKNGRDSPAMRFRLHVPGGLFELYNRDAARGN